MSKATEEALSKLHGALAKDLTERIEKGTASASDLSVALKMLKDNGITCDPDNSEALGSLADTLPDDLDDNVHSIYG